MFLWQHRKHVDQSFLCEDKTNISRRHLETLKLYPIFKAYDYEIRNTWIKWLKIIFLTILTQTYYLRTNTFLVNQAELKIFFTQIKKIQWALFKAFVFKNCPIRITCNTSTLIDHILANT